MPASRLECEVEIFSKTAEDLKRVRAHADRDRVKKSGTQRFFFFNS